MPKEQINIPGRREVTEWTEENEATGEKEKVYGIVYLHGEMSPEQSSDGSKHIEESPIIHIGWHKQGSPDFPDECVTFQIDIAEEEILRMAEEIRRGRSEDPAYQGVWWSRMRTFHTTTLTRPELNNLIRVARRARDAVFERDE